jgi:hypothetical protein
MPAFGYSSVSQTFSHEETPEIILRFWQGRTQEETAGVQPHPKPPKLKVKKHRFCRYYDIKTFTCFPPHPLKSVDE